MASVPVMPFLAEGREGRRFGLAPAGRLVWRRVRDALLWPVRVVRARRDLAGLAALSDRELCDIGLMRHDLRNATALPADADPTRYLAAVREQRRAHWAQDLAVTGALRRRASGGA